MASVEAPSLAVAIASAVAEPGGGGRIILRCYGDGAARDLLDNLCKAAMVAYPRPGPGRKPAARKGGKS